MRRGTSSTSTIRRAAGSNLIRHLLDRLPERKLPNKPLKLPKLKAKPQVEKLQDDASVGEPGALKPPRA